MRRLTFVQLDVFTSKPLEGNQLAVFEDGTSLSDDEMQRIAKETNFSETTFVLPREAAIEAERGVRVRIFTPQEELPFAGHPTLGTATYLRGDTRKSQVNLELNVGKIPVTFEDRGPGPAFGEMTQQDPEFGRIHSAAAMARITGLAPEDFRQDVPIQTVSTGLFFTIVPVKTLKKLQSMRFDATAANEYLATSDAKFLYFVSTETVDPKARLHARMIFYAGEDPATGSAAGCTAAWMAKYGISASGERVLIEQGLEAKRPSQLYVSAEREGERVKNVRVGGHAVVVARGEYLL
jgi:trans-2,3-dihydro-3-hydroxyanthranilate isomerase